MKRIVLAGLALLVAMPAFAQASDGRRAWERLCREGPDPNDAREACSKMLRELPLQADDKAKALGYRGNWYGAVGQVDHQLDDYRAALVVQGVSKRTTSLLNMHIAAVSLGRRDIPGAHVAIERAIAADPNVGFVQVVRGDVAFAEQRYADALPDFDRAIAIGDLFGKDLAVVYFKRGEAESKLGAPPAQLISTFSQAIALDPALPYAYFLRAVAYRASNRNEEALKDYDTVTQKAPQFDGGFNQACWLRAAVLRRELDRARTQCDKALALSPNPNSFDSAGMVALQQGRWQDAWTSYDHAVHGNPKAASALYGRGLAAGHLGRFDEAQADLAAAKLLKPTIAEDFASYGQRP